MSLPDRSALRRSLRLKRKTLSPNLQASVALAALGHVIAMPEYQAAQSIAVYWAGDGELDPALIAAHAHICGKAVYLPVVRRDANDTRHLVFARYQPGDGLVRNHFGIAEPQADAPLCPAESLDLVLVPLVGIDQSGNRLGMGGGFYDRTFAFKRDSTLAPDAALPLLVGFAHSTQTVEQLATAQWDIPVDAWVSETGLTRF